MSTPTPRPSWVRWQPSANRTLGPVRRARRPDYRAAKWELVRHAAPLPTSPDEDDLVALADAVREGRLPAAPPIPGFSDHGPRFRATAQQPGMVAPMHRPASNGRRRGHHGSCPTLRTSRMEPCERLG